MSWDVMIVKEKFDIKNVPDDYTLPILGRTDEIKKTLTSIIPELRFDDTGWSTLDMPLFSIEFFISNEEFTDGIMLYIRGGGDPLPLIKKICETCKFEALDCSAGNFIDLNNYSSSAESWKNFQEFRDFILNSKDQST